MWAEAESQTPSTLTESTTTVTSVATADVLDEQALSAISTLTATVIAGWRRDADTANGIRISIR
jgi:hypothetical protein